MRRVSRIDNQRLEAPAEEVSAGNCEDGPVK